MSNSERTQTPYLHWLDGIRGIAILWIFLVHFVERYLPGSLFANPGANWPPFAERIAQLAPLSGSGFSAVFANVLRYVGWLGDQGVQLFLVASGFGLTYAALQRGHRRKPLEFYQRRLAKLVPEWWMVHIVFVVSSVLIGFGLSPLAWKTLASFLGVRFLPGTMYYFAPAWWFVGLILQLYLLFPVLYRLVQGPRAIRNLAILVLGSVTIRLGGLLVFDTLAPGYLDWWSRGALFVTRLPDFAVGMLFAVVLVRMPGLAHRLTRGVPAAVFWFAVWMAGNIASFFLIGMSVAFALTAAGLFVLLYMGVRNARSMGPRPVQWVGRNSFSFYLVHHPVIMALVPATLSPLESGRVTALLFATLSVSLLVGVALQKTTQGAMATLARWWRAGGATRVAARSVFVLAVAVGVFLGTELVVRWVAPQEVLGWGERPALAPDSEVGYRLKPDKVTRLRWLGYDYVVESNRLGFPGPMYEVDRSPGVARIFVTGDAFESAEGVDTGDGWPRVLERELRDAGQAVEVLNFSITGWGPQHYDRATRIYGPQFEPDLVVVGFFVNEFFDVAISDEQFRESIGFGRPDPDSLSRVVRMSHTKHLLRRLIRDWAPAQLRGVPTANGAHLANLGSFDRSRRDELEANAVGVKAYMASISAVAERIGSDLLVVLVPASIQVCGVKDLHYMTRGVDPAKSDRYDLDQPQEIAVELLEDLGVRYLDLRGALSQADECPYHPRNMHWTEHGHEIVAEAVAEELLRNGWNIR